MIDSQLVAFAGVALILALIPGADTMLVIRNVLAHGRRAGILTVLGICSGTIIHAMLSALGLSLILVRSAEAFELVKFVGACYLVFLGVQSLWRVLRKPGDEPVTEIKANGTPRKHWRNYVEGLLTNLLNPKVAVFYLAFLPQFISSGDPVLGKSILLACIHMVMGLIWLSTVSVFVGRLRSFLTRASVKRALEATTGVILIGLGLRLAVEQR